MTKGIKFQLRLSEDEARVLKGLAKEAGLSLSEFIRRLANEECDEQARKTSADGLADPGQRAGTSEGLEEVHEAAAAPGLEAKVKVQVFDHVSRAGREATRAVLGARSFRASPGCTNPRCGRLKMALCEACREANK